MYCCRTPTPLEFNGTDEDSDDAMAVQALLELAGASAAAVKPPPPLPCRPEARAWAAEIAMNREEELLELCRRRIGEMSQLQPVRPVKEATQLLLNHKVPCVCVCVCV